MSETLNTVVIFKIKRQNEDAYDYYLRVEDQSICAYPSPEAAIKPFESAYIKATGSGDMKQSNAACIHLMHFNPSVCTSKDIEGLVETLLAHPAKVTDFNGVAEFMSGVKCNINAEKAWYNGRKPRLTINE